MKHDNTELIRLLVSLDISSNEAQTYIALLAEGSTSIRKIATVTGINRGTTYDALKHLVGIGLVSVKSTGGKREHYTAESPEHIYDIIKDKRRDLVDASNAAHKLIPLLIANQAGSPGKPIVRYYENDEGIATILKDVLQTCGRHAQPIYYAYSSAVVRQMLYQAFPQFTERRIADNIAVKVIAVGRGGEDAPKAERKWLPDAPTSGTSSYTIIYYDKIATISIAQNNMPYGVIIEDDGAANMQRLLFEQLWQNL